VTFSAFPISKSAGYPGQPSKCSVHLHLSMNQRRVCLHLLRKLPLLHQHYAGCAFLGGQVMGFGRGVHIHCEDCHFSGYFLGCCCVDVAADITLHRCTVQVGPCLLCVPVMPGGADCNRPTTGISASLQ
jgi:hypothetical protein